MTTHATRVEEAAGRNPAALDGSGFSFIREFSLLNLEGGGPQELGPSPHETGVLVLRGTAEFTVEGLGTQSVGGRADVFAGLPEAVYVPRDTACSVRGDGALLGVCRAACETRTAPAVIRAGEVKVMQVGRDNWSREVRLLIGPGGPSVNLLLGETLNPPGNWSGTPPHKHEGTGEGESRHEELYYFRTDRPEGWGIERLYSPERGVNELIFLRQNVVTFMPWGYHQIVSAPGHTLYYLFFLAGEGTALSGWEDPDHVWIKQPPEGGPR